MLINARFVFNISNFTHKMRKLSSYRVQTKHSSR